jgi:Thrombospondin type 3 repeat
MRIFRRFLTLLLVALMVLTATAYGAPGDQDDDGVLDGQDNCPALANPDQADRNMNAKGDVCDDPDGDGLSDSYELYTTYGPGPNFRRTNPDKKDTDGDGLSDGYETNRVYPNGKRTDPTLRDTDADGWEDGTEIYAGTDPTNHDTDSDGVRDSFDNCPTTPNPDQKNTYGNSRGDACEPTPPPPPCQGADPCQVGPAVGTVQQAADEVIRQLPGVDVRTVSDLARMGTDGYVLSITQSANDYFTVQVLKAGVPVALNLVDSGYYSVNGPVGVFAYDTDDTPAEGSRINVKWRYSARTKKLIVRVLPKQSHQGGVSFSVPPVGYPTDCTPTSAVITSSCDGNALGFYNPAKALNPLDALDAVPYVTTAQK